MTAAEKKQLIALLKELQGAVEELLLAGLTAASKSTIERIDVTFKEAARMKLLRLGTVLRFVMEETERFTSGSKMFSASRQSIFLGRAWLLSEAMRRALDANDDHAFAQLCRVPQPIPFETISAVVVGVTKTLMLNGSARFDFRLRATETGPLVKLGDSFVWSHLKLLGSDMPAEAALHLYADRGSTFKPKQLLDRNVIQITKCAVTKSDFAPSRITLGEQSRVSFGPTFSRWEEFWNWDVALAAKRLETFKPSPMDLDVEFQEDVFLRDWEAGDIEQFDERFDEARLSSGQIEFTARLDSSPTGKALRDQFKTISKGRTRPPLFGVMHYENCRLMFHPLSVLERNGPKYLTISDVAIDLKKLTQNLV